MTFGLADVIFLSWIGKAITAASRLLFARDYERHRSLRETCINHRLYGSLIFTVGLGRLFYTAPPGTIDAVAASQSDTQP
jgi:hypothetical protein